MPIGTIIEASFDRSFALYRDLIDVIDEAVQFPSCPTCRPTRWGCSYGAWWGRGSVSVGPIAAKEWSGFSCLLETTTTKRPVGEALARSADAVSEVLKSIDSYTEVQNRLIIDLLEKEAAHHGQLIRYLYGLKLTIPESWKSKYGLG